MDIQLVGNFLNERLTTRKAVEEAASIIGVSTATMYRYKSTPDAISLGQMCKLSRSLGLPLANGAVWTQDSILGSERRRLSLEAELAKNGGTRLITIPAYTVNDELPEITRLLLQVDYGAEAKRLADDVLRIRAERQELYETAKYESWEIWNGFGYLDFLNGRGRYRSVPTELRLAQINKLVASTSRANIHRFLYMTHSPELPMFGCHTPPGVALIRVDDIHLEFQAPDLVKSFEQTFENLRRASTTSTVDQFTSFLQKGTVD